MGRVVEVGGLQMVFRHVVSILCFPFIVIIVFPSLIHFYFAEMDITVDHDTTVGRLFGLAGLFFASSGLVVLVTCILMFATKGQGTLAPFDPPKHLVVEGMYRFVRNPMISGVVAILIGKALLGRSLLHMMYAMLFFGAHHVYIVLSEEPGLRSRFGESYAHYSAHVPRWVPNLTPYECKKV